MDLYKKNASDASCASCASCSLSGSTGAAMPDRPSDDAERRRAARCLRDQRHRRRLREGKMMVNFEIDGQAVNWLIRCHALDPHALDHAATNAQARVLINKAMAELIKVSSRV